MGPQLGPAFTYDVPWGPIKMGPQFVLDIGYNVLWTPLELGPQFGPTITWYVVAWGPHNGIEMA